MLTKIKETRNKVFQKKENIMMNFGTWSGQEHTSFIYITTFSNLLQIYLLNFFSFDWIFSFSSLLLLVGDKSKIWIGWKLNSRGECLLIEFSFFIIIFVFFVFYSSSKFFFLLFFSKFFNSISIDLVSEIVGLSSNVTQHDIYIIQNFQ